jgi:hypothetical protein
MTLLTKYDLLSRLREGEDPVQLMRRAILETGGTWPEGDLGEGLFEVQFENITGLGSSARAAVEDWAHQAQAERSAA